MDVLLMPMGRPAGSHSSHPRSDRKVTVRSLADFPPPTPQPTACRLWQGSVFPNGYGKKWGPDRQDMIGVHRWVWEQINGPTELDILHRCDHPLCYRYEHLFTGTAADNAADMMTKDRGRGQFEMDDTTKLAVKDAAVIKQRLAAGESARSIGRTYGVHGTTIARIRDGKMGPT